MRTVYLPLVLALALIMPSVQGAYHINEFDGVTAKNITYTTDMSYLINISVNSSFLVHNATITMMGYEYSVDDDTEDAGHAVSGTWDTGDMWYDAQDENWNVGSDAQCEYSVAQTCIYDEETTPAITKAKYKWTTMTMNPTGDSIVVKYWDYNLGSYQTLFTQSANEGSRTNHENVLPSDAYSSFPIDIRNEMVYDGSGFQTLITESKLTIYGNPKDLSLDTGNDGSNDYKGSGELSSEVVVNLDTAAFNSQIENCYEEICNVTINITSNMTGILDLYSLSIEAGYYLNLTFDNSTNATLIHSEGGNISILDQILYDMSDLGIGKVSITFNDDIQLIEFYNDNVTSIVESVHVTGSPDKVQEFTVWDAFKPIEEANVWIYELTGEDEFSLIWASFTENQGLGSANLVSGKEYRFRIEADGYDELIEERYIVPSAEDTLNFIMVPSDEDTGTITTYTDCPGLAITPQSCSVYVTSTETVTRIDFDWQINNTGTYSATVNNTNSAQLDIVINSSYYNYTINASVNNNLVGMWNIRYENATDREYQVTIGNISVNSSDMGLFTMFIITIAAALAGFAQRISNGTGIYVFGIIMALFAGASGAFLFAGVAVGILVLVNVAGRIL